MKAEFWNDRYREEGFAYGTEPNDFLKDQIFIKQSNVLCLAEGEGRNAIYLAEQGHKVKAIDLSNEGLSKMQARAKKMGLEIEGLCADLDNYTFETGRWDAIVIVFGHFPPELRKKIHSRLYVALKPGGRVIIEAYRKDQLNFSTGGPALPELLYSKEELAEDFARFEDLKIEELHRTIHEGKYHNGLSSVIRVIASKKN